MVGEVEKKNKYVKENTQFLFILSLQYEVKLYALFIPYL
jgi:hypothetical protein